MDVVGPRSTWGAFHLGARGDVLFLRSRPGQWALGPYVDVATFAFENVDAGGGAELLVPASDDVQLVLSAGAFGRSGLGRSFEPGFEGTLFGGTRSYNFHSWYGLAVGIFAQTRWMPESPATFDVVGGVQIDAELLALPALFLYDLVTR